jgi:hypothetical protein
VLNDRQYFDLAYQLLGIFFALVPVALPCSCSAPAGSSAFRRLGFTFEKPALDFGLGLGLAAAMGVGNPRRLRRRAGRWGSPRPSFRRHSTAYWWTVPVLILSALRHAVLEEVLVVGYLFDRLRALGWSVPAVLVTSALLRGSYHLYQGIGPFLGNVVMGWSSATPTFGRGG